MRPSQSLHLTLCSGPILVSISFQTTQNRPTAKRRLAQTLGTTRKTRELNQFGSTRRLASQEESAIPVLSKAFVQTSFSARTVLCHQTVLAHCIHTIRSAA